MEAENLHAGALALVRFFVSIFAHRFPLSLSLSLFLSKVLCLEQSAFSASHILHFFLFACLHLCILAVLGVHGGTGKIREASAHVGPCMRLRGPGADAMVLEYFRPEKMEKNWLFVTQNGKR
jgi:hypothetical protein